ncbi:DUF4156 domain-containing protein [Parachitinimonas caeni]|uniref:DUF4156 domain-containing protein n=1 Tax=Parachitinimonas caeni TaxID=3031301 RepID=A0ABT7DT44_9NEIS|nr:DUF4156 domain-containing protein [Parachitinimonas caeni]MDK2123206.1 DUF4156 domain-containing protein [Parachitinimonas caeni]
MLKPLVLLISPILLLTGCANWVKVSALGSRVAVVTQDTVASCKKLGDTTATVTPRFGIYERSQEGMGSDLDSLARNAAADMNGDAIVATSPILDGKRSYAVYRCGR